MKIIRKAAYDVQHGKGIKILSLKQRLQRLARALAQVKAGSTFEKVLNEVRQDIYSLYRPKEFTEKV